MKKNYENSLREIIKEYNLKPKKKLGQNFLHDKNIISSIVNKANIEDEDIIEIGPGPGILTESILCLLYTSPSPRDRSVSRMPSSA